MISLPEPFLDEIDRQAKAEHRSRSEFLREAVRFYSRGHARQAHGRQQEGHGRGGQDAGRRLVYMGHLRMAYASAMGLRALCLPKV